MNELYDRYHKPLIVIENGIGTIDEVGEDGIVHDDYRIDYLAKRYGFVYVDMDDKGNGTPRRSRKDSFWWTKKVCACNGVDLGV